LLHLLPRPYDARIEGARPLRRPVRPKDRALEELLTQPDAEIRALLLDFDGLIIDTESAVFEIWQGIFADHAQQLALSDWQHALGTHGGYDPAAHLAELTGGACDPVQLEQTARARAWEACRRLPLLPGVAELCDAADARHLGLAVASSSPRDWVEPLLDQHGLRSRLGAICVRADVAHVKPAPDLFLLAAGRLGVEARASLVFEDSANGVKAARAAGMRCACVPNALTRRLPLPDCDLVIDSLAEMPLGDILARLQTRRMAAVDPAGSGEGSKCCALAAHEGM
jgi:putative hydrolase of the HAD superfamily